MKLLSTICLACILGATTASAQKIHVDLQLELNKLDDSEFVSALVYLPQRVAVNQLSRELAIQKMPRSARHEKVVTSLQQVAVQSQPELMQELQQLQATGGVSRIQSFWIVNAISVRASKETIIQLAERGDVKSIYLDYPIERIEEVATRPSRVGAGDGGGVATGGSSPEPGLTAIRAPEVWALGITGNGVLVSSIDTGVSGNHPALNTRWAGTANPAYAGNPQWAWFDPFTSTSTPASFGSSHGSHTMGTICGGAPGDQIGVAPDAQWIHAASIDRGGSFGETISDAILSFQWIADPDGDPATDFDVPCVCSNSWGVTGFHGVDDCDEEFWQFVDAIEAAGCLVVFAAGNEGDSGFGVRRPADRATTEYQTLAVAAVDGNNSDFPIAGFSSRGPSFCTPDGSMAIKPDIAAPGVAVRSCDSFNGYQESSGTSMAAPHIAGVVALISEANPNLTSDEIKQIMFDASTDLGSSGEDIEYGWGIIDAFEAVQIAISMNILLGDVNQDGVVDLLDVSSFVDLIVSGEYQAEADVNRDGVVDLLDVAPFIDILIG